MHIESKFNWNDLQCNVPILIAMAAVIDKFFQIPHKFLNIRPVITAIFQVCRVIQFWQIVLLFSAAILYTPIVLADIDSTPLLVSKEWLKPRLAEANLVVVDTRDPDVYSHLHIENAVNIPVSSTFENRKHQSRVAAISVIQSLLSAAGINNDSHIVLYDDSGMLDAAREFWVLEVYGHSRLSILNGGFQMWANAGYPSNDKTVSRRQTLYIPTIVPGKLSTKFSTRLAISDKSKIIVDARSEQEYIGTFNRFERAGHIPSAINIPATMIMEVNDEGVLAIKPKSALNQIFGHLDRSKKIIAYCNKGKESALTFFALRQLGFVVSAYDGSWYEWNSDSTLPIETGSQNMQK